ncbi:MAG: hypothetical protein KBD21_01735 [Candidatus Pacebacteria bacterium]|nr:hypothetical protein [Candidatus Paceibacterota bacterium]
MQERLHHTHPEHTPSDPQKGHGTPSSTTDGFFSAHPNIARVARASAFAATLSGVAHQHAPENVHTPSLENEGQTVTTHVAENPTAIEARILTALPDAQPDQVEALLVALKNCPSCGVETGMRPHYALTLFERLPAHEVLRLSSYSDVISDQEERKYILAQAIKEVSNTHEHYVLLAATYDSYASVFTDAELTDLFVRHLSRFPASFANTLGTRDDVRALLHSQEDSLRTHFKNADIHYEDMLGTFTHIMEAYGESATATLLAVWGQNHDEVLYNVAPEIARSFNLSTIEQLFITDNMVEIDPYTLLEILYERTKPDPSERIDTLVTQAIEHINTYSYPQITLRNADKLLQQLSSHTEAYEYLIVHAMERCVQEGSYRALIEYYEHYANSVHGEAMEPMLDTLSNATWEAYSAGDYTSFLTLYDLLPKELQAAIEMERAIAENARTNTSTEAERYGKEFDLQQPFDPSHLPFSRNEMERYLARTMHRAIEETTLQGGRVHGEEFKKYYGHSFISVPIEDLNSVLYSDGFAHALETSDLRLTYANVFMLAEGIARMVRNMEKTHDSNSIERVASETLSALKKHQHDLIIGPGVKTIIATHRELSFDPSVLRDRVHGGAGGFEKDLLFVGKGVQYEDGVNVVKRDLLRTIAQSHKGATVILLSGHGSPEKFGLDGNTDGSLDRSLDISQQKITYQELGDALIQAHNPDMRVVLVACYSHDYLQNLTDYITQHGGVTPLLQVAGTNEGKVGFYYLAEHMSEHERTGLFDSQEFLDKLIIQTYEKTGQGITVEDIQQVQGSLLQTQGVGVFLRTPTHPKGGKSPVRDTKSKKNDRTALPVIEIVLKGTPNGLSSSLV